MCIFGSQTFVPISWRCLNGQTFYIFEDNKVVIRMIRKKSRSPNLRYVSRTQCSSGLVVWRIDLDSSFSMRHARTTEQLADF